MTIYFDENFPHQIAHGLQEFEHAEKKIQVLSTYKTFGRGVKDEDLIPMIGEAGAILVTRDQRIAKNRLYMDLVKEFKVGIVFVKQTNRMPYWEIVEHVVRNWQLTKKKCRVRKPFALRILGRGKVEEIDF